MNIKCEVIRDLLPLYVDGVASEETCALIEEHLKECAGCSEYLKLLQEDLPKADELEFANEAASLRKIKRKINLGKILIAMVTLGFAILAGTVLYNLNLTEYAGSLEENVSYTLPSGYKEVPTSTTDVENYKQYVRESSKYKETIIVSYNGLQDPNFISSKDIIHVDASTDVEISAFDWSTRSDNELYCTIQHGDEEYFVEYKCKVLAKDNYYSSCSQAQQDDILAFIKTFDYHRPANGGGNSFSRLYHNLGAGGFIILILSLLFFIGIPIAIAISAALTGNGDDGDIDAPVSSRDLHDSMNRERKAKGEPSLPAINNVQGASSNNLARRDHSWSSVPDFFAKMFRRK